MSEWLVAAIAAVPGCGALIAVWRVSLANRAAIQRLTRAINRQEHTIAALEGREPHILHPFRTDNGDDE